MMDRDMLIELNQPKRDYNEIVQGIKDGKIKKHRDTNVVIYNYDWLVEHADLEHEVWKAREEHSNEERDKGQDK